MLKGVSCGLLVCALLGCGGSDARAPIEDRRAGSRPAAPTYAVQPGETLYSIAFRYGLDFRQVAAANGIVSPYTIYPGQSLALREAPLAPTPARTATTASVTPPVSPSRAAGNSVTAPVKKPRAVITPSSSTSKKPAPGAVAEVKAWRWPASGRVTRVYSSSVHKGIDISGRRGDPILAVADGTVVYAGTGIVGFGELLIVKHNDIFLSAYGHNDLLVVAEGENVRAGQKIAEKGSSGTDTVKLHFEIRREGKPVDPLRLLPKR